MTKSSAVSPAAPGSDKDAEILYQNEMGLGLVQLGARFPKLTYGAISAALARAHKARERASRALSIDFCGPRPAIPHRADP